ncbi:universal stress protein [Mesosutterella sp. OilRF-GAM-744-9]|uniref:Universal stress protein n=1 Tax=Mesosutterella porci TaxID=2915351 RepID=A0ABS9MQ88_9BURK|nr:universal stress protein [Mesosutterella sp. oilRF-744-WT-GAM-9]MCG5030770.1 universal stress protein [Mesosutterella sp. oilRF-744-WT-GAM-9]
MKILLPIDGSAYSTGAAQFVADRIALLGQKPEVELFNVQPYYGAMLPKIRGRDPDGRLYSDDSEKVFGAARAIFQAKGMEPAEKTVIGLPASSIAEEAGIFGADLIAMGSRGLDNFKKLFLGSATTGVLARVHVPVLVIRDKEAPKAGDLRVGIAVDGSETSLAAARFVAAHRDFFGSDAGFRLINVVNVFEELSYSYPEESPLPETPAETKEAEMNFENLKKKLPGLEKEAFEKAMAPVRPIFEKAGIPVKEVCLSGDAGIALSKYAKKKLDFIVMGTRGRSNVQSILLGSATSRVAADGKVPMLVVPA